MTFLKVFTYTCMLMYQVKPWIKTSLAPGSGVVTKYLLKRYTFSSILLHFRCLICHENDAIFFLSSLVACKNT